MSRSTFEVRWWIWLNTLNLEGFSTSHTVDQHTHTHTKYIRMTRNQIPIVYSSQELYDVTSELTIEMSPECEHIWHELAMKIIFKCQVWQISLPIYQWHHVLCKWMYKNTSFSFKKNILNWSIIGNADIYETKWQFISIYRYYV